MPNESGASAIFPYITFDCVDTRTNVGAIYPFAFMSGDAQGPGDEVVTVARMLKDRYEFWVRVDGVAAAGDVTVRLLNASGTAVRSWKSPANPSAANLLSWHLFNIDGASRSVVTVNETLADPAFAAIHPGKTDICPP